MRPFILPVVAVLALSAAPAFAVSPDDQLTALENQLTAKLKPAARKDLAAAHDAWLEFRAADGTYSSYGQNDTSDTIIQRGDLLAQQWNRELAWLLAKPSPKGPSFSSGEDIDRCDAAEKREKATYKKVRNCLSPDQMELLIRSEVAWERYLEAATQPNLFDFHGGNPDASPLRYRARLAEARTKDLEAQYKRLMSQPG
jgi:uncharacterized protein YecT (DUF1311 family)